MKNTPLVPSSAQWHGTQVRIILVTEHCPPHCTHDAGMARKKLFITLIATQMIREWKLNTEDVPNDAQWSIAWSLVIFAPWRNDPWINILVRLFAKYVLLMSGPPCRTMIQGRVTTALPLLTQASGERVFGACTWKYQEKKQKEISSTGFQFFKVSPPRNPSPGARLKSATTFFKIIFKNAHLWRES